MERSLDRVDAPPSDLYRRRFAEFGGEEARLARISRSYSIVRFAVFLVFLACLFMIVRRAAAPGPWPFAAGAVLLVFIVLVGLHDRVIKRQRRFAELARINQEALWRLARDWASLPLPTHPPAADAGEPLARDLNLFGRASLFHLLGTAHTPPGKAALAGWLLGPAPPPEVALRQEAVAELAPEVGFRQELELHARRLDSAAQDLEPFLSWAEGEPWLLGKPWLVWGTRVMTAVTVALVVAAIAGAVPASVAGLPILVNLVVSHLLYGRISGIFDFVSSREGGFQLYADLFALLAGRASRSERLRDLERGLVVDGLSARRQMQVLQQRVALSHARHSAPLHFILEVLFLWDFHVLFLLERWQRRAGRHARRWLAALGEVEALAALAALRFDNPGWAFPALAAGGPALLAARDLGHPLVAEAVRVCNDLTVGPPGTFLLVTGSNMSGKSTLLRSIGTNVVLAQAGGPVCAAEMRLPPLTLGTSILVEDSLADGVSFFLAELQRIRRIVDLAARCRAEGRTLLYLLDEVLRGTNSYERQVAVRRVLATLIEEGAIGAISTHDLQLAGIEELAASCRPVHFRETFHRGEDGPVMTFDYKMRPGVATTTNALKLLELVGLLLDEPAGR